MGSYQEGALMFYVGQWEGALSRWGHLLRGGANSGIYGLKKGNKLSSTPYLNLDKVKGPQSRYFGKITFTVKEV